MVDAIIHGISLFNLPVRGDYKCKDKRNDNYEDR